MAVYAGRQCYNYLSDFPPAIDTHITILSMNEDLEKTQKFSFGVTLVTSNNFSVLIK